MAMPLSLLLIDDHPVFLRTLARLLGRHPAFTVLATTTDPIEGVWLAECLAPDVVLLDLDMPQASGLDLLPRLRAAAPSAHLVVITFHDQPSYQAEAFRRGAAAFLSKTDVVRLLPSVLAVLRAGCTPAQPEPAAAPSPVSKPGAPARPFAGLPLRCDTAFSPTIVLPFPPPTAFTLPPAASLIVASAFPEPTPA